MSVAVPSSVGAPLSPQVNLLPPEVGERKARGQQRTVIMGFSVLAVLLIGALGYWASLQKQDAQEVLDAEMARGEALAAEKASYAEVPVVRALKDNGLNARVYVGGTEVLWEDLSLLLEEGLPPSFQLQTLAWNGPTINGPAPTLEGPFDRPDIGFVLFSGKSKTYLDVALLEEAMNAIDGFERTEILSASREDGTGYYVFSGVVRADATILSRRFSEVWYERVAAEIAAEIAAEAALEAGEDDIEPTPSPSPSPSPTANEEEA